MVILGSLVALFQVEGFVESYHYLKPWYTGSRWASKSDCKCFIFVCWPNLKNWLFSVFKGTKYLYEALPFKEIVIDCPKHISWRICIANSRAYQIFSRLVYNHLVRWLFHLCLNQISFVSYYMQVVKMISTKCLSLCQVPDHFLRCKFLLLIFLNSWVNIHYCIFF